MIVCCFSIFFFFKQKTAYEMRISDWSSDVCSSDLGKTGPLGKDYNMRWIASMVADVHRILTRGGIFMYPRDERPSGKAGKLRLMYEAKPMSFIVEQAGGDAIDGSQRIIYVQHTALHQRKNRKG